MKRAHVTGVIIDVLCVAWTPLVRTITAFWAVFNGLGPLFYTVWGPGKAPAYLPEALNNNKALEIALLLEPWGIEAASYIC